MYADLSRAITLAKNSPSQAPQSRLVMSTSNIRTGDVLTQCSEKGKDTGEFELQNEKCYTYIIRSIQITAQELGLGFGMTCHTLQQSKSIAHSVACLRSKRGR